MWIFQFLYYILYIVVFMMSQNATLQINLNVTKKECRHFKAPKILKMVFQIYGMF